MLKAGLCAIIIGFLPSAADALTLVAAGTGVIERFAPYIDEPVDTFGRFGVRGASLLGKSATITITIDLTATPPVYTSDGYAYVSSGSFYGYPGGDPSRTADIGGGVITIDGVSQEIDGASSTSYLFRPAGYPNCSGATTCVGLGTTSGAGRFGGSSNLSFDVGSFASGAPTSLFDVPTGGNLCARAARCEGSLQFDESGEGLYGRLRLSSLTFSTASVPEPSTWMTMVLGFGVAGAAMRRGGRRSSGTTA
jgi:hypothetical protein